MNVICKLFGFVLRLLSMVVDFVAQGVVLLGDAAVDVLSELAGSVGSALGLDGIPMLPLLLFGGLAFFLLTKNDSENKPSQVEVTAKPADPIYNLNYEGGQYNGTR